MSDIKPIETKYNGYRFRSRLEARWAVFFDVLGIKYEYEQEGFDCDGLWYLPDFYLPDYRCLFEVKHAGILDNGCITREWLDTSQDGPKIRALTEGLNVHNDDKIFDYLVIASGDPFDCLLTDKEDCGLVFNGMVTFVNYSNSPPATIAHNQIVAHMPITMEAISIIHKDGSATSDLFVFGKRSYNDLSATNTYEAIPCGARCVSLFALANRIIPRFRHVPLFDPSQISSFAVRTSKNPHDNPIAHACTVARQARFEHGETPII